MLGEVIESSEFDNERLEKFLIIAQESNVPYNFKDKFRNALKEIDSFDNPLQPFDHQKMTELLFGERFGNQTLARYAIFYARAISVAKLYDRSRKNPNTQENADKLKETLLREISPVLNTEYKAVNTAGISHDFEQMVKKKAGEIPESQVTLEDLKEVRDKIETHFLPK